MPGFDGTGPRGMGPMTGGRRGFCAGPGATAGWRPGFGMGFGQAMGPWMPSREEQLEMLKAQAGTLAAQLEQIQAAIDQLGTDEPGASE